METLIISRSTLFLESRLGFRNLHETVLQAATTNGFTIWRLKYPNILSHSWWKGVSVWILGKAAKTGGNAREDKGKGEIVGKTRLRTTVQFDVCGRTEGMKVG